MQFTENKIVLKEVCKRFFNKQPIKISLRKEGQCLTERGEFQLGLRVGPEIHISNLFHEMGHFAEREVDKLLQKPINGWGFIFGKFWECDNQSGWEPQTDQQVLREGRVWSYQLSLSREFGIKTDAHELSRPAHFLPAFPIFQYKIPDIRKEKYQDREQIALDKLAEIIEEGAKTYTYEKFVSEWFYRLENLKTA